MMYGLLLPLSVDVKKEMPISSKHQARDPNQAISPFWSHYSFLKEENPGVTDQPHLCTTDVLRARAAHSKEKAQSFKDHSGLV